MYCRLDEGDVLIDCIGGVLEKDTRFQAWVPTYFDLTKWLPFGKVGRTHFPC